MSEAVWSSSVTQEMIDEAFILPKEINEMVKELDDAVMEICLRYGLS
jgi:hypothetical protein